MPERDYLGKVYDTLKEGVEGFDKDENTFRSMMSDTSYASKVHSTLGETVDGFDKTPEQFYSLAGSGKIKTPDLSSFNEKYGTEYTPKEFGVKNPVGQATTGAAPITPAIPPVNKESVIGAWEKNTQDLRNSDVNLNSFYIGVGKTELIPDATIKAQMQQEEAALSATKAQYKNKTDLSYKELVPVMNTISGFYLKDQKTIDFLSKTNESGDRVADPVKVDEQAKAIARQYKVPEDGYFKNLIYEDLKSKVDYSYKEKDIVKQADALSIKQFGKPLNELVNEDFQKNFKAEKEIKATAELQAKALATQITSENNKTQQEISNSYDPIIKETNGVYEQQSKSIAADLDTKLNGISDAYKAGLMDYETYTNEFNATKQQAAQIGEQVHAEYVKNFQAVSSEYLTKLKESAGKYDARYKRQLDEIDRISNSRLTEEAKKYSASYKMSPEMAAKYKKVWEEASVKVGAKYEEYNFLRDKAKGRIDLSIQSLTSGLGTGIKGISSFMDFEEGKLFGDVLSTRNTLSSANIGGAGDLLDLTKVIRSSGEMIGGMTPMLAANAIAAMATQGTSIPTQMMLLGGLGWSLETMQMAGDTRNEVFTRTGSLEDADNAAKKIITGQLALIPLYGLSGLPFIGKATLGIKNAGVRMLAKGGVEVLEEIPQEFFQSSIEDIAKENKELSEIGEKLTLERLRSTALNVAPSTFLMGAAPSSFTLAKDSWAKMEAKAYGAKQDISRLSPTGLQQFMYEITLRHGEAFAKSYLVGLEQTNKIDAIQLDELNRAIDMVKPTVETTKKFGFTAGKSKVYASILFDYQKVLANIDTEADPIAKKALETKAKELEAAASDFLNTGTADYAIMHLPNGEQYLATYSQVQNWLNDERFANRLINGSIDITIETSKDKSTAKLLQGVIADLKTQKPKPSEKLSLTENIKQNTEKSQEQLEADKERVSEIQSMLASDNLSMQEQGVGNLIPEARQELVAELETINAEQEIVPATETPAAPTSGVSGEVQELGDVTTAETSERVVYDREPTANDGVYKILGDFNNIIYRVNPATGRIQEFSDGLWSNTASNAIARGTARKQGFQKIKDPSKVEQLTNKQNDKESNNNQSITNEADRQVVLEGVRETGNENEVGEDGEQLREEEVADLEKIRKEIKSKYKLEIISKGNGFHLLRNGKTISIFNTLQEAEQVLENRIDDLVNAVITQPIDLGDNISVNGITVDGVTYSVLNVSERMVTIVNIGGVNVPFYLTTGLGGKNLTPSWYPMFGYSQSGWLNKTDGKDMEAYYERLIGKEAADVLKKTAEKLNKQFGTTPNSIKQTGILTGEQTYEAVNSVLNFTTAENQKIDASVNAKEELVKLENNIKSIGKEINAKYDAESAESKAKQAKETTKSLAEQISDLRAAEKAEYAALKNPTEKAKKKIYDKYDKLITPLIREQKAEQKAVEVAPKEGDTSTTKSFTGATQKMVFTDGEWQLKVGNITTKVAKSVQQEAQDTFNEENAPVAEAKEQAPVVKEQAAPPVKAEEKPVKEQAPVIEAPKLEMPVVEETITENEPTVEEEEEQYEPITVSDTSHDTFTKDNAVDYEEGEREGDNGRSYPYLASVTVELVDDVSGDTIGTISKLKDEDGEITWNAENNDGDLVAEEYSSKSEAQQALVDNYNKDKAKEFNKEKARGIKERTKERIKEAEKAAKAKEKAAKEQAPVVKEQAAPPVKAEEKEDKEQKEPVKEQVKTDSLDDYIKSEDGTPLILSHGTDSKYKSDEFEPNSKGLIHFSRKVSFAMQYGSKIINAYLLSKKPFNTINDKKLLEDKIGRPLTKNEFDSQQGLLLIGGHNNSEIISAIKSLGYDSIAYAQYDSNRDKYITNYIVFDKKNIQVVDANGNKITEDKTAVSESDKIEKSKPEQIGEGLLDVLGIVPETDVKFSKTTGEPQILTSTEEKEQEIVNQMNKMNLVNNGIDLSPSFTTEETIDLIDLNSRLENPLDSVNWSQFKGMPFGFTISDQLTTGEAKNSSTGVTITNLKGGIGFNGTEGNQNNAWANTTKKESGSMYSKALAMYNKNKPLFEKLWKEGKLPAGHVPFAVVKMAESSIISNEAIRRAGIENLKTLPEENRKKAAVTLKIELERKKKQEEKNLIRGTKLKKVKGTPKGVTEYTDTKIPYSKNTRKQKDKLISQYKNILASLDKNNYEDIVDVLKNAESFSLPEKALIFNEIFYGKPNKIGQPSKKAGTPSTLVSETLVKGLDKSKRELINIGVIADLITEPSMKNVPNMHVVSIIGVKVAEQNKNGKWVKAGGSTTVDHPNYKHGVEGKSIGILTQPVHMKDAFGEAYGNVLAQIVSNEAKRASISIDSLLTQAIPVQAGLPNLVLKSAIASDELDAVDKLAGFLRQAFPSTTFFTSEDAWDAAMEDPSIKKKLKDGDVVYAFTTDGNVFINPNLKTTKATLHETGHIWMSFVKENNPALYAKGLQLVTNTREHQKAIKEYGDTELAREEALMELMSSKGDTIVRASVKAKFKEWLLSVYKYVADNFTSLLGLNPKQIENLTLDKFLEGMLADILSGKKVTTKKVKGQVKFSLESQNSKIRDYIESQREAGESDADIRAGVEMVADKLGLTKEDIDSLMSENESPTATEEAEFTPSAKDIKAFEKILETTSGAIRNKNIAEAVKVNPKIQEIMDNFEDLKKQLMDSVELTEDCSW